MVTQAVNVEIVSKKPEMKSFGVDLQNVQEINSSNDFAKSLKVLLSDNEVNKDSLVVDTNGNQIKVADLMEKISDGKDMLGEDVVSMVEQLMAQLQLQVSQVVPQAAVQSAQDGIQSAIPTAQSALALMFQMPQIMDGLNKLPANTELKSSQAAAQAYTAGEGVVDLAEAFKGVMKSDIATPVMNNTGKIDISDFKLLLSDASKELQSINMDMKFTVLGEKEIALIDAMPQEIAVEDLLKETDMFLVKDNDAPQNNSSNVSTFAQTGAVQHDNKNLTIAKDSINIEKLRDIDIPIMKAVDGGTKNLLVRLDPPDLGSVQIKLSMNNGLLRADFKVDSSAVKDLFTANMPHIKASLENSGLRVGEFFVDVREEGFYYSDDRRQSNTNEDQKQHQQNQHKQAKDEKFSFSDLFA
ncbi:MAG: flagellar hook-length control protein FliK [Nitrospirae bacterium]|nr:flagellar hook-length control protein FliK [Nitrospirota bacterium]